ncbi:MAG: endonuclease YncB(thermonuclease family) [Verrucomicrobiales bacterium]|jgi:endonuclease YncB( thermonuclease family)
MARRNPKDQNKSQLLEKLVIVLLLAALGAAMYFNYLSELVRSTSSKQGDFDVLRGSKFVDHGSNDGDSFHIAHGGKEFVFRLYYVDCPEKSARRFQNRLADQGKYFGGIAEEEVVELGLEAKDFVEDLLKRNEFIVYTRWEEVYDSGRFFALIEVGDRLLSEILIERGMARIYTKGVGLPDGESFKQQREDLRALESTAKAAKVGGWR